MIVLGVSTWANSANAQFAGAGAKVAAQAAAAAPVAEPPLVQPLAQTERGREMFVRQWTAGDSHTPAGDGLGPMFNAQSCADCHNLGGLGGAGKNKNNVDLLNVILPANKERIDREKFRERMTQFHPAFTSGTFSVRPFITLHKFGNDPEYAPWRISLLLFAMIGPDDAEQDAATAKKRSKSNRSGASHAGGVVQMEALEVSRTTGSPIQIEFKRTQRNTPALFGAGLIDSIPDDVIRQAANDEAKRNVVKGQVALSSSGKVGKFGWRGQTATLKQFVMGACANELGLQVPGQDQPIDPLDPMHKSPGLDLTQEQCDDLTAYVASLPAPTQRIPHNPKDEELVKTGEHLFKMSGCAACHMERLGDVTRIYSDLLLHDMGQELADPVPASIERTRGPNVARSFSGGYYANGSDVFVDVPPATRRLWRTPPLWGVADSAPYLHDGRAATLEDAIMAHSGEATPARQYFGSLPAAHRGKILAFLKTLTAG
jgi:CxxC motif-containing protein (DUF1111 family)